MYCIDFEYDGHFLSEYDSMICLFGGDTGFETKTIGSTLTFNTVANTSTGKHRLVSTQYDEVLSTTFQIGKNSCADRNNHTYSDLEVSQIMRWLNKRKYKKFKPVYDNMQYANVYYMGTFNVSVIKLGFDVVGFEVVFTADASYGYYEELTFSGNINRNKTLNVYDRSDEIGSIYPSVEITINEDADTMYLFNSNDTREPMCIKNIVAGEKIIMNGNTKILESNMNHEYLYNDFNFIFPYIANNENENLNIYSSNINCDIKLKYNPICKAAIMV